MRAFGLVAIAATLALVAAPAARAQTISPGPLSKPHERLEGIGSCMSCHEVVRGVTDAKCLACHDEIATRIATGRGYHAALQVRGAGECAACHRDHVGRDFELIDWPGGDRARFPHADTGFALEGAHAGLDCATCHAPARVKDEAVRAKKSAAGALERTFLGLEAACASCHADPHAGSLGGDCRSCHAAAAWAPAPGFDHGKTAFPLRGAHAATTCARCHTPERGPAPAFRGVPHQACTACHEDRHDGRFGPDCRSCHDEAKWKPASYLVARHERLPLLGAHGRAGCAKCHGARLERDLAGASCASCHEDRVHRGALGGDCARCHGVETFAPAAYVRATHAAGRFPLEGKHAAAACERCHVPVPGAPRATSAAAKVSTPRAACEACHETPHRAGLGNDCDRCHGAAAWGPAARFDAAAHARTAYPLAGAHARVECAKCHAGTKPGPEGPRLARLAPIAHARCRDCHADAHRGELARRPDGGACESCHDVGGFRPARFDRAEHGRTAFPLAGAHAAVACAECHGQGAPAPVAAPPAAPPMPRSLPAPRPEAPAPPARTTRGHPAALTLKPRAATCAACHVDPHRGQYGALPEQGRCEACHDLVAFLPARAFDHAMTAFPLEGRHAALACTDCHVPPAPGRRARPASGECAACHADPHLGQFARPGDPEPLGCNDCHGAMAFRPAARFDHARDTRFPLDGKHAALGCAVCHRTVELAPGLATVLYRPLAVACAGCHVEQHAGEPWSEGKR